jgi:RNase P subunit RPR2
MQTMLEIPRTLRGRGCNECTPILCQCGEQFLFGLSNGTKGDHSKSDDIVLVTCPTCKAVEQFTIADLVAHNGQKQ